MTQFEGKANLHPEVTEIFGHWGLGAGGWELLQGARRCESVLLFLLLFRTLEPFALNAKPRRMIQAYPDVNADCVNFSFPMGVGRLSPGRVMSS